MREASSGENVLLDILNGLKAILSLNFCPRFTILINLLLIVPSRKENNM